MLQSTLNASNGAGNCLGFHFCHIQDMVVLKKLPPLVCLLLSKQTAFILSKMEASCFPLRNSPLHQGASPLQSREHSTLSALNVPCFYPIHPAERIWRILRMKRDYRPFGTAFLPCLYVWHCKVVIV